MNVYYDANLKIVMMSPVYIVEIRWDAILHNAIFVNYIVVIITLKNVELNVERWFVKNV
jgi:hypothetical protein